MLPLNKLPICLLNWMRQILKWLLSSVLSDRQRHSSLLLLTLRSRLVNDKHNSDSVTKCMITKTLPWDSDQHSKVSASSGKTFRIQCLCILLWWCQHVAATHTLCCVCLSVCVCSLLPCRGSWAFKSLEEWSGSAFAFEAGLKERQQTWMLSGQNLVWWDHWLTGDVLLPAPDGRSPTLHQLTVGFTRTFCTNAKRLSWINCNTNPIKLKSLWKHQPKTKECRIKGEIYS